MTQYAQRRVSPEAPFQHRNLPLLLLQARERVIAHFRPALNAAGVTEQQWRIVRALLELGPLEPRQIVVLCAISSPSLAGVLARMEDVGLVTRTRLDHDQRRLQVSLTARSRALARRLAPQIDAIYAGIEARMGHGFTQEFYRTLDQLIASLDEGEGDDGSVDGHKTSPGAAAAAPD
ncbi:homoprotocatechuate degradation operon regulator HpaR [Pseudorhodoferax sp.]|uniref:homoprotocatechuate degradation operon regulator HpaR n=1 Tax=Pseudorhodoferax sp. TaxID=1993553 RepID=UPI002DD6235F|nr:homoprotocatechuate degradation operon regulator HpaR [Pseudorhodoferax sp.]